MQYIQLNITPMLLPHLIGCKDMLKALAGKCIQFRDELKKKIFAFRVIIDYFLFFLRLLGNTQKNGLPKVAR